MSLVSDALKKAQREAAAREAREKGLPEQLMAPGQPFRARRAGARRTLVVAATAAVVAGAAVAWFLRARPSVDDSAPPATAEAPMKGESETSPASARPTTDVPASPEAAAGSPPSLAGEVRVAPTAASGAAPASTPAAPEARPGERTFVREARLEGGVALRLGGVAWSDVAPLAYLNGQLLGVGESVSGWTIERIERDRVRLSGPGGRVVVSLR